MLKYIFQKNILVLLGEYRRGIGEPGFPSRNKIEMWVSEREWKYRKENVVVKERAKGDIGVGVGVFVQWGRRSNEGIGVKESEEGASM